MWECRYAKEPFDLRLFVLRSLGNLKWILLAAVLGTLLIGGGYYLKNVTFGGRIPYQVTTKFYVDFGVDPVTQYSYSYFEGYTWNDWLKSDELVPGMLEKLSFPMTKEEFISTFEASLQADLRMPYVQVVCPDKDRAMEITRVLQEAMTAFADTQKEIDQIRVVDTVGPVLQVRDIRTLRACVLGAVTGTFFALFWIAFRLILDEAVYVPETFTWRYQIPAAGYLDRRGRPSRETGEHLRHLFEGAGQVGITAVEPQIDLRAARDLFPQGRGVCIPSPLQVPEAAEKLRQADGVLLLVQAGIPNGKAILELLHFCQIEGITVTCALLVGADERLIECYRGRIPARRGKGERI